jgi:hypothetical protein
MLGTFRHRWEDCAKMDQEEMGYGYLGWIHLAQDRIPLWTHVNTVMNLGVP